MSKAGFKDVVIEKGEKLGLYAAAALMVLFVGFGIYTMFDTISPEDKVKKLQGEAQKITSKISIPATAPQLSDDLTAPIKPPMLVDRGNFPAANLLFNPVPPPDNKRSNPTVARISEIQADIVFAKILAFDIQDRKDGKPRIGLLEVKAAGPNTNSPNLGSLNKTLNDRYRTSAGPGTGGATPPPNMMMPKGEGPMPPMGGQNPMGGSFQGFDTGATRDGGTTLKYVELDDEKAWQGKRLAQTLLPQQLVVVQATFPYKEQLDKIREALRLDKIEELYAIPDAVPVFRGVQVERRVFNRAGRMIQDWTKLDYENTYRKTIFPRSVEDQPDDPDLAYVTLDPAYGLVMPLPRVLNPNAPDSYPRLRLPALQDTIARMKEANKLPVTPKAPKRIAGDGNIFAPRTLGNNPADLFNYGGGNPMNPMNPMGVEGPFNPYQGMRRPPVANMPIEGGMGTTTNLALVEPMDMAFIRIIDNNIRPGDNYQYRMRIVMENPNFGKNDLMSRSSDANEKLLMGEWTETPVKMLPNNVADIRSLVGIPQENFLYATEPTAGGTGGAKAVTLKADQAMLQIQRWVPQVDVETGGKYKEPVGDWLVADAVVTKGQYIGGKQLVQLPLWSSELNWFTLRPIADPKHPKAEPKRGVMLDPVRAGTDLLVVDIAGGKVRKDVGDKKKQIEDESAVEVLLLDGDGNLQVRNSAVDRLDSQRADREANWKRWVSDVEKYSKSIAPPPMGGTTTIFN